MRIEEIKSKDIKEDVEKHETLNPKLFEENKLKDEVREKILQIVNEFKEGLEEDEIKFNIKDVIIVGSNASYNYNKDSDLDVHIVVDTKSLKCPDNLYPKLYGAYRSIWNSKYDIDFYGINVELFVETDNTDDVELNDAIDESKNFIPKKKHLGGQIIFSPKVTNKDELQKDEVTKIINKNNIIKDWKNILDQILSNYNIAGATITKNVGRFNGAEEPSITIDILGSEYNKPYSSEVDASAEVTNKLLKEIAKEIKEKLHQDQVIVKYNTKPLFNRSNIEYINEALEESKYTVVSHIDEVFKKLNEEKEQKLVSNGIYSVMNNEWIKEPIKEDIPEIDKEALDKELKIWEDRYNKIVDNSEEKLDEDLEDAKSIIADQVRGEWEAIRNYQKAIDDLKKEGSYEEVANILNDISDEEEVHVGELQKAQSLLDDNILDNIDKGEEEALEKIEDKDTSIEEDLEKDKGWKILSDEYMGLEFPEALYRNIDGKEEIKIGDKIYPFNMQDFSDMVEEFFEESVYPYGGNNGRGFGSPDDYEDESYIEGQEEVLQDYIRSIKK